MERHPHDIFREAPAERYDTHDTQSAVEATRCGVEEVRSQLGAIHDHLYDLQLQFEKLREEIHDQRRS